MWCKLFKYVTMLFWLSLSLGAALNFYVNDTNTDELLQLSKKTPVFFLVFSPHCGHCAKMHPFWIQMMEKYNETQDLIIAEADALASHKGAHKLFQVRGYPSFAEIYKGKVTEYKVIDRTLEGLCKYAEKIRTRDTNEICSTWTGERYPAMLFGVQKTEQQSCNRLKRVIENAGVREYFCHVHPNITSDLMAMYSEDVFIEMNASSEQEMVDLVKDYSRDVFGNWEIATYKETKRKVMIVVYQYYGHIQELKVQGKFLIKDWLLGKMTLHDYNSLPSFENLTETDLPAMLISDEKRETFTIWKSVNRTTDWTAEIKAGTYVGEGRYRMSLLVPPTPQKKRAILWILLASFVAIFVVVGAVIGYKYFTKRGKLE